MLALDDDEMKEVANHVITIFEREYWLLKQSTGTSHMFMGRKVIMASLYSLKTSPSVWVKDSKMMILIVKKDFYGLSIKLKINLFSY